MPRIRRNVWSLPAGDSTLAWYERAVAAMMARPIADPTSWRYQAAIHDYDVKLDPLHRPADVLPPKTQQTKYWSQCQHGCWYFLPWHRMYLHFFEQMALAEIIKQGGPADWALPYWNYSASKAAALLPPDFRSPTLPNGMKNHLYVKDPDRAMPANAGTVFAGAADTDLTTCLQEPKFEGQRFGGSPGFGGPDIGRNHDGGTVGMLESTPHGNMHMAVAANVGWMASFKTAALDPIFWLHHCNIDRLWEVWRGRDPRHTNPTSANWLTSVAFDFHDASGTPTAMTPSQVVNMTSKPLDYAYDDISDPLSTPTLAAAAGRRGTGSRMTTRRSIKNAGTNSARTPMAEMLGATSGPFKLAGAPVEMPIDISPPGGPARTLRSGASIRKIVEAVDADRPPRVLLNIEGVTSQTPSVAYDVFLNLPRRATPSQRENLRAGRVSMFGLVEASRTTKKHASNGLHYTLDITAIYQRLAMAANWSPKSLRVSLEPVDPNGPVGAQVGRLSVYIDTE